MSAVMRVSVRAENGLRMVVDLPEGGSPADAIIYVLEAFKPFDTGFEPDKLVIVAQVSEDPDPPATAAINAEPPPPPKDPGKAMA